MAKVIRLVDEIAVRLVNARAEHENRSAANAAETTIIEALTDTYGKQGEDTPKGENWQHKIRTKNTAQNG